MAQEVTDDYSTISGHNIILSPNRVSDNSINIPKTKLKTSIKMNPISIHSQKNNVWVGETVFQAILMKNL